MRDDVSAAVDAAAIGDTVTVPKGGCVWSDALTITKGINLIGTGVGSTTITATGGNGILVYAPADYTVNAPFRVSGFTFDLGGGTGHAIQLGTAPPWNPSPDQTRLRIDHNRFTNGATGCNTSAHALSIIGPMYGVADNNTIDHIYYPIDAGGGGLSGVSYGGQWSWDHWHLTFGEPDNNFYYEDNVITWGEAGCSDGGLGQCQYSGRYAFRYNTIVGLNDGQPIVDMHGNQGGGADDPNAMWSCFGGELYGNQVTASGDWLNQRGGEVLSFYNDFKTTGSVWFQPTEEHADSEEPTMNPEPQHVHNTYYWNNRRNETGALLGVGVVSQIGGVPAEGSDFWTDATGAGVECGHAADRPATCATGQAFWVTDRSCTDLTGMVGAHPATPIAGTLYRCTAPGTWTAFYTPLKYPHPLRTP